MFLDTFVNNQDKLNKDDLVKLNNLMNEILESKRTDNKEKLSIKARYNKKFEMSANYDDWQYAKSRNDNLVKVCPILFKISRKDKYIQIGLKLSDMEEIVAYLNHKINYLKGGEF